MKKYLLLLLFSLQLSYSSAQRFEKGNINFDAGLALGIYGAKSIDKTNNKTNTDGAASRIFSLNGEYGITNWFGAGLSLGFSHYLQNKDSVKATGINWDAHSTEICATANAHFVRTNHTDLFASVLLGLSPAQYNANDKNETKLKATGPILGLQLQSRFIIGNHFAFSLYGGYQSLSYKNGTASNKYGSIDYSFVLKGGLAGFKLGWKF